MLRFKYISVKPVELRNDGAMVYALAIVFAPAEAFPKALHQTVPGEVTVHAAFTQGELAESTLATIDRLGESVEPIAFAHGPELTQPLRRKSWIRKLLGRS